MRKWITHIVNGLNVNGLNVNYTMRQGTLSNFPMLTDAAQSGTLTECSHVEKNEEWIELIRRMKNG